MNAWPRSRWRRAGALNAVLAWGVALASFAHAQTPAPATPDPEPRVQAYPTREPITLDGRLDESVWTGADPAAGFRQIDPEFGAPARFATEVRVAS